MKKLRILGIVVFVIAAVSFGYFKYEQINSKDNQAPVITMDADSVEVSCQAGDEEFLKGITAKDSKDGDVTSSLIVESISNFMENHTRNMTVVAFDSDNHATKSDKENSGIPIIQHRLFPDGTITFCYEYTGHYGNTYLRGCTGRRRNRKDKDVQ